MERSRVQVEAAKTAMQTYARLLVDNKLALINTVSGGPFTLKNDCAEITQFDTAYGTLLEKIRPWMVILSHHDGGVVQSGKQFIILQAGGYFGTSATYMAFRDYIEL